MNTRKPQQQRSDPGGSARGGNANVAASGTRNGSASGPRHLQREREVCFDFLEDVELDEDPAAFTRVCNLSNYTGFEMSDVRAAAVPAWKQNSLDSFARHSHLTRSDEQLNHVDNGGAALPSSELFAPRDPHSCSSRNSALFSPVTSRRFVPASAQRFLAPNSSSASASHFRQSASGAQRPPPVANVVPNAAFQQRPPPHDRVDETNNKGSRSQNPKESPSTLRHNLHRILHSLRQSGPLSRRTRNTSPLHQTAPTIRLDDSCAAASAQHTSPSFKRRTQYVRFQSVNEEGAVGTGIFTHSPHHHRHRQEHHHPPEHHQKGRNHSHSESDKPKAPPLRPPSSRRAQSHRIEEEAVSEFTPRHSDADNDCDGTLARTSSDPLLDKTA